MAFQWSYIPFNYWDTYLLVLFCGVSKLKPQGVLYFYFFLGGGGFGFHWTSSVACLGSERPGHADLRLLRLGLPAGRGQRLGAQGAESRTEVSWGARKARRTRPAVSGGREREGEGDSWSKWFFGWFSSFLGRRLASMPRRVGDQIISRVGIRHPKGCHWSFLLSGREHIGS